MDYYTLLEHRGHEVVLDTWGKPNEEPWNVSITCETCQAIIIDFDHPGVERAVIDAQDRYAEST